MSYLKARKIGIEVINELRPASGSNIYTRGPYTSQQLALLGIEDSVVGGCPTHFMNPDKKLGEKLQAKWQQTVLRRVSVAAGHESWVKRTDIEHQLIAMMMDEVHPGQYVVQSMLDMLKISRGEFDDIKPNALTALRRYTVPHYSEEEFKAWCRRYAVAFYDVAAWMDSLRRFDLAVGPRYHGVALAIQTGVMGLTIAIDSRTRELCEQTGVPYVMADDITGPLTRKTLRERYLKFDGTVYDAHRQERAQNYARFLIDNGLSPSDGLLDLAELPAAKAAIADQPIVVTAVTPPKSTERAKIAAWQTLAAAVRLSPEKAQQEQSGALEDFKSSPEFALLTDFWQLHCNWQPLPPKLCQRVLALPSDLWALFCFASNLVVHRINLVKPHPAHVELADRLGLRFGWFGQQSCRAFAAGTAVAGLFGNRKLFND